jgi:phosphoribosylglycinamide formyltransferase-1
VAVLVSGGGSNLEALLKAKAAGELPRVEFVRVVSSKPGVFALERAKQYGVPFVVVERQAFADEERFQRALEGALVEVKVDVICLAGYLRRLDRRLIERYRGRILNIHPALLPKFGGAGLYGHRVHEAVLASGEAESGCTVHLVDEEYDHGPVLAQARVPVLKNDTPEQLAARVLEQEHRLYPKTLRQFTEKLV